MKKRNHRVLSFLLAACLAVLPPANALAANSFFRDDMQESDILFPGDTLYGEGEMAVEGESSAVFADGSWTNNLDSAYTVASREAGTNEDGEILYETYLKRLGTVITVQGGTVTGVGYSDEDNHYEAQDGSISEGVPTDTAYYPEGTQVTVRAFDAPEGQVFDRWMMSEGGDVSLSEEQLQQQELTLTVQTEALTFSASYKEAPVEEQIQEEYNQDVNAYAQEEYYQENGEYGQEEYYQESGEYSQEEYYQEDSGNSQEEYYEQPEAYEQPEEAPESYEQPQEVYVEPEQPEETYEAAQQPDDAQTSALPEQPEVTVIDEGTVDIYSVENIPAAENIQEHFINVEAEHTGVLVMNSSWEYIGSAPEGSEVHVELNPEDGYGVTEQNFRVLNDTEGSEVSFTRDSDNLFTFIMPASAVTITITAQIPADTAETDDSDISEQQDEQPEPDEQPIVIDADAQEQAEQPEPNDEEAQPQSESETQPQSESEAQPQSESETQPQSESETQPQSESETQSQSESETQPQSESETQPQSESETQPQSESETQPQSESETHPQSESETQPQSESESEISQDTETENADSQNAADEEQQTDPIEDDDEEFIDDDEDSEDDDSLDLEDDEAFAISTKGHASITVKVDDEKTDTAYEGADVEISAKANDGYTFTGWKVSTASGDTVTVVEDEDNAAEASFIMPAEAVTVQALTKEKSSRYTVTVENGSGSGTYEKGDTVTIVANNPATGYRFSHWEIRSGSISLSSANSQTASFTMPGRNVSIAAQYERITYTLTVSSGSGSGSYYAGQGVTLSANWPDSGKEFDKWVVQSGSDPQLVNGDRFYASITMPASDSTIAATYKNGPSANDNTISGLAEGGEYLQGEALTFTAIGAGMDNTNPNPGDYRYRPISFKIGSTEGSLEEKTTRSMVINALGDYVLTVYYAKEVFDGSSWKADGSQVSVSRNIHIVNELSVNTGDSTPLIPIVIAAGAALLILLITLLILIRRRR